MWTFSPNIWTQSITVKHFPSVSWKRCHVHDKNHPSIISTWVRQQFMNFSHPMTCVEKFRFWIIACQPDPIANWKVWLTGLLYLYYYNTNVKRIKDNWGTYVCKELNDLCFDILNIETEISNVLPMSVLFEELFSFPSL